MLRHGTTNASRPLNSHACPTLENPAEPTYRCADEAGSVAIRQGYSSWQEYVCWKGHYHWKGLTKKAEADK